jgi:hypothetical protein
VLDGDRHEKATGSPVELEHERTICLLGREQVATRWAGTFEEQLRGLSRGERGVANLLEATPNRVVRGQATEQLEAKPHQRTEKRTFGDDDSAVGLPGAVLIERDGDWSTGRRHLHMAGHLQPKQACESSRHNPGLNLPRVPP